MLCGARAAADDKNVGYNVAEQRYISVFPRRKIGNMNCALDNMAIADDRLPAACQRGNAQPPRRFLAKYAAQILILVAVSSVFPSSFAVESGAQVPAPPRRNELINLVRQDCGSCHGLTLKGGLGPALLPETLKDKPPAGLVATILYGRPDTAMPPWQRFLSESEAEWIVINLQKGFPGDR